MALRRAYAQPLTLIVYAHNLEDARAAALKIAQGIGSVIDTVDTGASSRPPYGTRSRRVHLNFSTADLREIPRVVKQRGR